MTTSLDRDPRTDVVHTYPPKGGNRLMPCCNQTPAEVPGWHRITFNPSLVTCGKETR